jgi:hypothetical protein
MTGIIGYPLPLSRANNGKKETGIGMVLSLAGIALCVQSKS